MAEVDISPLAKRLAEENNVNWRSLDGSGDDGRIVERDVLDYLARVMAGDEAADPTPEPLPDGMGAWPDGPPTASGEPESATVPNPAPMAGDDDLLEVESSDATAPSEDAGGWSQSEWGGDDWSARPGARADSEDDFFAGIDELEPEQPQQESTFDFGGESESSGFELGSETESGAYDLGGDDQESPEFDFGAEAAEDRSAFDTSSMEPAIDEGIFVFDDEPTAGVENAGAPAVPAESHDHPSGEDADFDLAVGHDHSPAEEADFALAVEHHQESGDAAPGHDFVAEGNGDPEHTPWEGAGATAQEVEAEVATEEGDPWEREGADSSDLPASDAPWTAFAEEPDAAPAPQPQSHSDQYSYLDQAEESLPDGVRIEEDEYRVRSGVGATAVAAAVEPEVAAPAHESRGTLLKGGVVLRREVDVTAVLEASRALAGELGAEPALAAFLLRAAVRAGTPWPLQSGGAEVGMARLSDDGIGVSVLSGAGTMQFRDLVAATAGGSEERGEPALAVADVSELGIDEAVLDLGVPVLTIGRVLESDGGRPHATLTLSGTAAAESGSKFLGRVAELLAAPVRLVL